MPPAAPFLDESDVAELLSFVEFPDEFELEPDDDGDYDYASRFKYPHTSPTRQRSVAPECEMAVAEGAPLLEVLAESLVDASFALPFAPRGSGNVPIFISQAVTLVSEAVPPGYVLWLDGYAFNLFPSQANELNYNWQLRVNGKDILNTQSGAAQLAGRPVADPTKVPVAYNKSNMIRVESGSLIEVVVTALNTLGASDSVSAAVFGTLEGIKS